MSSVCEGSGGSRGSDCHEPSSLSYLGLILASGGAVLTPAAHASVPTPEEDPFYAYEGSKPLASIAPGTVLKTRTLAYHVVGLPLPVKAVQLLYRSRGELGQPTVERHLRARAPAQPSHAQPRRLRVLLRLAQPDDDPSYAISGGLALGGLIPDFESLLVAPELSAGNAVVIDDTEGETADLAAGPEYGFNTVYSVEAALNSPAAGLSGTSKVGLIGYSGGAIATEWAAELAPTYAPELDHRIVGAALGGTFVDPAHNLRYINGSTLWAGVMPIGLIGIARAFHIDLTPYLSEYGLQLFEKLQKASIIEVLAQYPGSPGKSW